MDRISLRIALAAATLSCSSTAHAAKHYTYTTILVPNSQQTVATAINDAGTVLGFWFDANYTEHCFIFQNGQVTSFDEPDAANGTSPSGINASGEIAGSYFDSGFTEHGFTYVPATGVFTTVPVPGGIDAELGGIDSKGTVFGLTSGANSQAIVFSYRKKFKTLPITGSPIVASVSDKGSLAGTNFDTQPYTAYLYAKGTVTTLPLNAIGGAAALGVNSKNEVVGQMRNASNVESGFLYANGTATSVTLNGVANTALRGINDAGVAVGVGYSQNFSTVDSFTYEKGKFTAISEPNGTATAAEAINNAGQIVGSYTDNTSGPAAFLATPN
jgi:probable HAF family extracellular repeat protein